jgi:enediyne biosynthesis protein E4
MAGISLYWTLFCIVAVSILTGCTTDSGPSLFTLLPPEDTGIRFENTIPIVDLETFEEFPYIFNGGGVALGDINNNGLPDVFLTGNLVSSRLYMNKGNFRFEDITESAGLMTSRWITGVSMVDITNNGYPDIYLSVTGMPGSTPEERANLLYINN